MKKLFSRNFVGALLAILVALSACQPVPTPSVHPQARLTVTSTAAARPQPTSIPASPTETSEPTITPPVPPTPVPDTWQTFTDPVLNITLRYPQNWMRPSTAQKTTRLSGADGFFELSTRAYPASLFDRVVNLCVTEANDPNLNNGYGSAPLITEWQGWEAERQAWFGFGCTVSPLGSDGSQAVLFARDARPEARNQLVVLRSDAAHFGGILSSLRFVRLTPQEPSSGYYDSPACKETPRAAPVTTIEMNGLQIREYAIANAACDPWQHLDGFQARVTGLGFDRNAIWKDAARAKVEAANRTLAPFGYRMIESPANSQKFDLLKGDAPVAQSITRFSAVSVNTSGDDFILWVQDGDSSLPPTEISARGLRTLANWYEGFNTVWAGNDLVSFEYSKDKLFPVGAPAQMEISKNGNQVQTISIPQMGPAGSPVRGLWSWRNHWVTEVAGVLFQDGLPQNSLLKYDEIFDWHLVNGKPFFLTRQSKSTSANALGAYGLVYDGQALPLQFDDIIHGDLCCDPARYTIQISAGGTLFYALKDGVWFLVSIQTVQ